MLLDSHWSIISILSSDWLEWSSRPRQRSSPSGSPSGSSGPSRLVVHFIFVVGILILAPKVLYLPPLSEGEGLASRIIQVTPATFLSPVLLEVPHFASLDSNREIVVLRSENGKKWSLHTNTADTDNQSLNAFLNMTSINNLNNNAREEEAEVARSTITTRTLPQFLAVVSRPRQEQHLVGPEGGDIVSSRTSAVQVNETSRK